jgi:hypothetical protein
MMKKNHCSILLTGLGLLTLALFSSLPMLHASTVGGTVFVETNPMPQERPDVAYDTINNRYLVVYSEGAGLSQEIVGKLFRADGTLFGGPFNISNHPGQPDAQPAAAYKAATNEYLVVWRWGGTPSDIVARRVSAGGGLIGGPIAIAATPADEVEPDVAADPLGTGRYLVAWWEVGSASNRGQRVTSTGVLDGGSFPLFSIVRTGPRVAYGESSSANYFLTATTDAMGRALVRAVQPGLPPDPQIQVNVLPTAIGPGYGPTLAYNLNMSRWLVAWAGQNGNQIRGRFVINTLAVAPPATDVLIAPPLGPANAIRSVDVAAGLDTAFQARFNVAFDRLGDIYGVPLDQNGVIGPQENLFVDGLPNDARPAITYARIPNQFFTVWQHDSAVSVDIYGQRHQLP